jgi:hypothetical protein
MSNRIHDPVLNSLVSIVKVFERGNFVLCCRWFCTVISISVSFWIFGCSAERRETTREHASIRLPLSTGDDPLLSAPIEPPRLSIHTTLTEIDTAPTSTVDDHKVQELSVVPALSKILDDSFGRFTSTQTPIPGFDQSDEDEDGGSASDRPGPPELVPTPRGAPEVKAEIIPTPQGIPEAMLAREAELKKMKLTPDTPPSMRKENLSEFDLGQPTGADIAKVVPQALIDATTVKSELPDDYTTWPVPNVAMVVTGQQHGYIEPCGCTGLANQKGGVARRMTFMSQLVERGWTLLPIDGGNQVRRRGRQAEIKLQRTAEALKIMGYKAVGFGPDDLRLGLGELISVAAGDSDQSLYVSSNVVLLDPSLLPQQKVIESGGMKIGVTTVLDPKSLDVKPSEEVLINDQAASVRASLAELKAGQSEFNVLVFSGDEERGKQLVQEVAGYHLLVISGGLGEPTYRAEQVDQTETRVIITGNKGMYAGLVGIYNDLPMRYSRVPLTDDFADAPPMRRLMSEYQKQLRDLGFEGLGLKPIPHPNGNEFVGSKKCGECHTTAYEIWENTPHFKATESLVHPGERGDVSRHFDPECLSCHVTGWNPQNFYPYTSGYLDLEKHAHLHGNGCENCHGPGSAHAAAEVEASGVDQATRDTLRLSMQLPLSKARERCIECHDLDNSPDFHEEGAFENYWAEVEHYGKD